MGITLIVLHFYRIIEIEFLTITNKNYKYYSLFNLYLSKEWGALNILFFIRFDLYNTPSINKEF